MRPARWLAEHHHLLPVSGDALDVACGSGRNARWLAERGLRTRGVDRDEEAVRRVDEEGRRRGLPLRADVIDLEQGAPSFGTSQYDVIVVINYLYRPLLPILITALRPGGILVYETFTVAQAGRGHPRNPAFLLREGELPRLLHPLQVLAGREGDFEGAMVASAVARKVRA